MASGRQAQLLDDALSLVLLDLQNWHPTSQSKRDLRRTTYVYFHNNADRMRYKTFRSQGYDIRERWGEASCKQIATQRMKLSGMHWRQGTSEAILALRRSSFDGRAGSEACLRNASVACPKPETHPRGECNAFPGLCV